MSMEFNAIDVFSGSGGMSLGAAWAGIKVEIAVENNQQAADTFQANHPDAEVFRGDIRDYRVKEKKSFFVLFGGPPCQGFSISNTKTRNDGNMNNTLFNEFIRLVEEVNPYWFVFENVEGIKTYNKGRVLEQLRNRFRLLGFSTKENVLVASDFGVPQRRSRFFMVGNRLGVNYEFPEKVDYEVSVKDAISDLPSLRNGDNRGYLEYKNVSLSEYAKFIRMGSKMAIQNFVSRNQDYVIERYSHIKPGENWRSIPRSLMSNYANTENCHSGIYKRLHPDQTSVVIANYRKNMLIHPFENRGLSVREAARIQSFPDTFVFKGSLMSQQQQIGNAVPPLLASAIFSKIVECSKGLNEKDWC